MSPSKPGPTPPPLQRKRGQPPIGARASDGTDVLQVLVFCKLLTPDQIDPVRRAAA